MRIFSSDKVKKLDIKVSRSIDNIFLGNYKTAFKGSGIEFADIRKYVPGDSVKHIDWITSAKQGSLYIKKFEEERQLTILFLIDVGNAMQFGIQEKKKFDTMMEVLYILAFSGVKNNDKIGAIIYDDEIRDFVQPKKGKANLVRIINSTNKYFTTSKTLKSDREKALRFLNQLRYKRGLVFVLTDDIAPVCTNPLSLRDIPPGRDFISYRLVRGNLGSNVYKLASLKNEVVYINIFDSFENNLLDERILVNLSDGKNKLNINLSDQKKKDEYVKMRKEKLSEFKNFLLKNGIDYLLFDEKTNIFKELLGYFKFKNAKR